LFALLAGTLLGAHAGMEINGIVVLAGLLALEFLGELPGSVGYELLPYHRFGEPKYNQLGKEYPLRDLEPQIHVPEEVRVKALRPIEKMLELS